MDVRSSRRRRWLTLGSLMALVLAASGCTSALFTAMYLIKGNNDPAECAALKEKTVVVVCRPVVELQYRNAHVDRDIAEQVSYLLKKNVPKVKVVDHRKVAEWMDEKNWEEFVEVGKALKADMVVGIDLEGFKLLQGQTLYQGQAELEIKVFDCKTGQMVFRKRPPATPYPPNRMVQTAEKQEGEFRQEFVRVLSDRIARYFYDHDRYDNFAMDAKTIE